MASFNEELNSFLQGFMVSNPKAAKAAKAWAAWKTIAAEEEIEHTENVVIIKENKKDVLVVYLDNAIWAADLNARSGLLLISLKQTNTNSEIERIKFRVSSPRYYRERNGEKNSANSKQKVEIIPLSEEEKEEIWRKIDATPASNELKMSVFKAAIKDLEWKNSQSRVKKP